MVNLDDRIANAVRHFWRTRTQQGRRQGKQSGRRDAGNRRAATGGKQLDGFIQLITDFLIEAGLPEESIHSTGRADVTLPGFFRPTKQWDLVVVAQGNLLAAVECKALCGPSFGNNYNNRVEEAIGSATDLWTAFRERKFESSPRPFLGYVLFLESAAGSTRLVGVQEKHFPVFDEFRGASYAQRCQICLRKFILERCYDATALVMSSRKEGIQGQYREPARDLEMKKFIALLCSHVIGCFRAM